MQNVQNIKSLGKSTIVEYIFLSWLFCLPFGSSIGGISLGILTIYPSLVLLFALFPFALFTFKEWNPRLKYVVLFLLIWFLAGLVYPKVFSTPVSSEWKFDIRSLGLQFLTIFVIIGIYYKLGAAKFFAKLKTGTVYFLLFLITFGLFEFYSGIHFKGVFTDKLLELDAVSELYYAPVFVYGNPNDFMVYLILVLLIYLVLLGQEENKWRSFALLLLTFLFAFITNARIAQFAIFLMVLVQLIRVFWDPIKQIKKQFIIISLIGGLASVLLLLNNPIFIGPKYAKGQFDTNGNYVEFPVRPKNQDTLTSFELRKNLFLNGVSIIKEHPIFGIGPGGFKKLHAEKKVPFSSGSIVGPHNYPIELVAGYGIFGWSMIALFTLLFISHLRKILLQRKFHWILFSIPVFILSSILPSSFLYLDINWIFVAVISILSIEGSGLNLNNERA